MAHILCVLGSPRKSGNSTLAASHSLIALHKAGHTSEIIQLCDYHIKPCVACGVCDTPPHVCPLDGDGQKGDAARQLLDRMHKADAVLLASPVYFYGTPAHFKALIDRSQRYWTRYLQELEKNVVASAKPAFVILTAARSEGEKLFDASRLILRSFMGCMGFTVRDIVCLRNLDDRHAYGHALAEHEQVKNAGASWVNLI